MRTRSILALLAGWLSLLGLLGAIWVYLPRLESVSPAPDSKGIAVDEPLRLTFTRPLRTEQIPEHLELIPPRRGVFWWEGNVLIFQPSQPWPGGSSVTVHFTAGARAKGILGLPLLRGRSWSFQTRQELLVYLWPASGQADLYALDPSTGEVIRLTNTQNLMDYSLGTALRSFFFSVQIPPNSSQIMRLELPDVMTTEINEARPEMILECRQAECRTPRLSPDGKWLAYEHTPLSGGGETALTQVWLMSLEDGQTRPAGNPMHTTMHPTWSSSGWLTFYDNELQGFIVQSTSGQELSFLPNQAGESGSWHPQQPIFFAADILTEPFRLMGPLTVNHLFAYELDESGVFLRRRDLTRDMDADDLIPIVSPDGRWLAFARQYLNNPRWTLGRQLWVSHLDEGSAQQIIDSPVYNHYDFAWSPDQQRLAFVRFNMDRLTDPPELWIINEDGSHPIQLVKGGHLPQWIP